MKTELATNYWSYIWMNSIITLVSLILIVFLLMAVSSILYKHWSWYRIKYRQLFDITDEDHIF